MRGSLPAAVAAAAVALAGCGGAGEERAATASTATTDLTVRVTRAGGGPRELALHCRPAGRCDERRLDRLRSALDGAADRTRVCTEIYGGPERAHVTGVLRGRAVDVVVTRSDGCGIADYDALFAALGRTAPLAP
jgi:hypothetical protein